MACILDAGDDLVIYDVKSEKIIFDPKHAFHKTFLVLTIQPLYALFRCHS